MRSPAATCSACGRCRTATAGTTLAVRDLFFNTPARRKFLRSEQTELGHVAALVTHYALAHPSKHFELHSATQALVTAPAVANAGERLYQIFGRETFDSLIPARRRDRLRPRRSCQSHPPGNAPKTTNRPNRASFGSPVSSPNPICRSSIAIRSTSLRNGRLIRDRLILHALTEPYRNIIPPTSFPVVLLFLELPPQELDVNVHPAKTEVRFRQSAFRP